MLLRNFKQNFLDKVLQILWNQWAALGVPGYSGTGKKYFADPEALIIATSIFGRYDPRLFDGMMDWLQTNGRYINIQRLKNILKPPTKDEF